MRHRGFEVARFWGAGWWRGPLMGYLGVLRVWGPLSFWGTGAVWACGDEGESIEGAWGH